MLENVWLIPLFPAIGFLINGFFGRRLGKKVVSWVGPAAIGLSFLNSILIFFELIGRPTCAAPLWIRDRVPRHHRESVDEVRTAPATHPVVVVGMRQNPFPRRARKLLDTAGIAYEYLEYGSYFSDWRRRSALKMWTGWPTFPMVFVRGTLIGGADDLEALLGSGELKRLLAA